MVELIELFLPVSSGKEFRTDLRSLDTRCQYLLMTLRTLERAVFCITDAVSWMLFLDAVLDVVPRCCSRMLFLISRLNWQ